MTEPFPFPLCPAVIVSNPELLLAVQPQFEATDTDPVPPFQLYEALPGEMELEHVGVGGGGGGATCCAAGAVATAYG